MADSRMIPIGPGFDMQAMISQVVQMYQAKGFTVSVMAFGGGVSIDFRKDDEGIKKYVGLALGIKANITVSNGTMMVDFTDAEWTGKIVGMAVGWFLCLIPFIIALVGCFKQSELPKTIANDIQMVVSGGAAPAAGMPAGQPYAAPQQPYQPPVQPSAPAAQAFCSKCGAGLNEGVRFCPACGTQAG